MDPATPPLPLSFFEQLPKTDLHVHLDGSLRLATTLELAEEGGVELPSRDPEALCPQSSRETLGRGSSRGLPRRRD